MSAIVDSIETLKAKIQPKREVLLQHPIYGAIKTMTDLQIFMQGHVFAVWDFMSLLKSLQAKFCPVSVPWLPPANNLAARLVNEIVLGEETDEQGEDGFASHFELYRGAMAECGADLSIIDRFVEELRAGNPLPAALTGAEVPSYAAEFVQHTFETIQQNHLAGMASAFTFGREDLLPDVFEKIVDQLNRQHDGQLDSFRYYLDRHIELDGDQHGPLAERLVTELCGDSAANWEAAISAADSALEARIRLWDALFQQMTA